MKKIKLLFIEDVEDWRKRIRKWMSEEFENELEIYMPKKLVDALDEKKLTKVGYDIVISDFILDVNSDFLKGADGLLKHNNGIWIVKRIREILPEARFAICSAEGSKDVKELCEEEDIPFFHKGEFFHKNKGELRELNRFLREGMATG